MHVKLLHKNDLVEKVWPANLALFFMFRPIALKQVNNLTSIDRFSSQWSKGNTSDCGARGPGFGYRLWQGFLCLLLCFVVAVLIFFCEKNPTFFVMKFCNSFCNVTSFCKWCDRLYENQDTDLAFLNCHSQKC